MDIDLSGMIPGTNQLDESQIDPNTPLVGDISCLWLCGGGGLRAYSSIRLVLCNRGVGPIGAALLGDFLCTAPSSVTLLLDGNFLGQNGLSALLRRTAEWQSIHTLHLSLRQNGLNDDALASGLMHIHRMEGLRLLTLDVGCNPLGPHVKRDVIAPFMALRPMCQWHTHITIQ